MRRISWHCPVCPPAKCWSVQVLILWLVTARKLTGDRRLANTRGMSGVRRHGSPLLSRGGTSSDIDTVINTQCVRSPIIYILRHNQITYWLVVNSETTSFHDTDPGPYAHNIMNNALHVCRGKYSGTNKTQQNKCRCLSSGVKLLMHLWASNFEFLRK